MIGALAAIFFVASVVFAAGAARWFRYLRELDARVDGE